jgi:hypothetical protein
MMPSGKVYVGIESHCFVKIDKASEAKYTRTLTNWTNPEAAAVAPAASNRYIPARHGGIPVEIERPRTDGNVIGATTAPPADASAP